MCPIVYLYIYIVPLDILYNNHRVCIVVELRIKFGELQKLKELKNMECFVNIWVEFGVGLNKKKTTIGS